MANYFKRSISYAGQNAIKRICLLKPAEPKEPELHTIELNAGKNILGRSKETGIRDVRCSKRQIEMDVDLDGGHIKVKVLGMNPCSVNGLMIMQSTDCEVQMQHGDVLEFVYGRNPFEVVFEPPPDVIQNEKNSSVPIAENSEENVEVSDTWESVDNGKMLVFSSAGVRSSDKVAAYDLDGTIIKTKSGNVFPKHIDDWQIIFPEVLGKLKRLHDNGFKICLMTNQSGISKGKVNVDEFKRKVLLIVKKLGVPSQVFIAITEGYYRKPLPGMWKHMSENKNGGVKLDLARCFFVGDAAGRPELGSGATKRKKDHSLVDRLFAENVGISFYTPEEHFLGRKTEHWDRLEFEPKKVDCTMPLLEPNAAKIPAASKEIILMVGLPGSGKSHFCQEHLGPIGYIIANADTLGGVSACLKTCEHALNAGQSCVVDNTNVDVEARKKFLDLAKKMQVPCRCFVMNATLAQTKHNIAFRHLTDSSHSKINDMVFNMLKKRYKEPVASEGFTELVKVNLKPKFSGPEQEELYKMYLVEK